MCRLPLVLEGRGSSVAVLRLLLVVASVAEHESQAQSLWHTGLVLYVGSSWTRDQTRVPSLAGGFLSTGPPVKSET